MENINPYGMMKTFIEGAPIKKHVKKKNGFDYLPWSIAYHYVKNVFPTCRVVKEEFTNKDGVLVPYMIDAQGYAFVKCTITWEGFETSEIFPITDFRNQAIKNPTGKDVDNSLQRCMTKCVAMFCGLGLSLWHGEDLEIQQVEAVGVDNSAHKAVSGGASVEKPEPAMKSAGNKAGGFAEPASTEVRKPDGPLSKQDFQHLISIAPDRDGLEALYKAHKDSLDEFDKTLFKARAEELRLGKK